MFSTNSRVILIIVNKFRGIVRCLQKASSIGSCHLELRTSNRNISALLRITHRNIFIYLHPRFSIIYLIDFRDLSYKSNWSDQMYYLIQRCFFNYFRNYKVVFNDLLMVFVSVCYYIKVFMRTFDLKKLDFFS